MRLVRHAVEALFVTVGASAACGGTTAGNSGSGSVSGTVGGTTFSVASEIAAIATASSSTSGVCGGEVDAAPTCTGGSSTTGQAVAVVLTNRADATCSALVNAYASGEGLSYANFDYLQLGAQNDAANVGTGTYDIITTATATSGATATFVTTTSTCGMGINANATGGTVTLTKLTSSEVAGSYDLTFGTQGTMSGSFDIPVCDLPDSGSTSGAAEPPCMP